LICSIICTMAMTRSLVTFQIDLTDSSNISVACSKFHAPLSTLEDVEYATDENKLPMCFNIVLLGFQKKKKKKKNRPYPSEALVCVHKHRDAFDFLVAARGRANPVGKLEKLTPVTNSLDENIKQL